MTLKELKQALDNKEKIVWNDPDPINGNDYTVQKIWNVNELTAMIHYGNGKMLSEAEVYLSELSLI